MADAPVVRDHCLVNLSIAAFELPTAAKELSSSNCWALNPEEQDSWVPSALQCVACTETTSRCPAMCFPICLLDAPQGSAWDASARMHN